MNLNYNKHKKKLPAYLMSKNTCHKKIELTEQKTKIFFGLVVIDFKSLNLNELDLPAILNPIIKGYEKPKIKPILTTLLYSQDMFIFFSGNRVL